MTPPSLSLRASAKEQAASGGEEGPSRAPAPADESADPGPTAAGWTARHEPPSDLSFSSDPQPASKEVRCHGPGADGIDFDLEPVSSRTAFEGIESNDMSSSEV